MPDETGNASTINRPVKTRQRDPPNFSGAHDADVHDWLKTYDRVSDHNRWDDTLKLANVVFFLTDTAYQWYDNHEADFLSWDGFKAAFSEVFGKLESRRQRAQDKLARRYQAVSESSTGYIEDVIRLCSRADPAMTEQDKIRHIFKGLSQELFSIVAPKSPPTVQTLIKECRKYEELRSGRISTTLFQRLPEVSLMNACTTADLPGLIRDIIRDELREFFRSLHSPADGSSLNTELQHIRKSVQDELRAALHPIPPTPSVYTPAPHTPTPICSMQPDTTRCYSSTPPDTTSYRPQRNGPLRRTDAWRTPDDRPVCFYCNIPGHIARYCHRRIDDSSYNRFSNNRRPAANAEDRPSFDNRRSVGSYSAYDTRRGRSPSPYPRRPRSVSPLNNGPAASQPSN